MITLSSISARKWWLIFRRQSSPLLVRFVLRLSVCFASTFGLGVPLAFYAVPRMIRTIAYGYPIGFVEVFLLGLWILTLFEMWQYAWRNILRLRGQNTPREVLSAESSANRTPEI
jgi:hypothetical protein